MKQVLSLALFIAFFVQLISPAQAISVERLFKMSIHGKTEFKGRASSVLDSQMLNIETFMTFRKKLLYPYLLQRLQTDKAMPHTRSTTRATCKYTASRRQHKIPSRLIRRRRTYTH